MALVAALRPGARLAGDAVAFAEGFAEGGYGLVLVDLSTAWADPLELASALRRRHPALPLAALGAPAPDKVLRFGSIGFSELYSSALEDIARLATRLAVREPGVAVSVPEVELASGRAGGDRRFAAEVAHDMREPVRTHRLLLERMERELARGDGGAASALVVRLREATTRLEELIDGALADLAPAPVAGVAPSSVGSALDEVMAQLAALVEETGAQVERGPLPEVGVAPHAMRQLLQNLIVNAIRHGGTPPRVHVSACRAGDHWQLRVRDWGPGVPVEEREAIFRPLARLVGGAAVSGHGLGLAICRKLAERVGGSISVGDAEGGGAVFIVCLPVAEGEARTEELRAKS